MGAETTPAASDPERELQVRVSDDERHRTAELLGDHAAVGRLTLGELEDRARLAYQATTRAELTALTRDLPAVQQVESPGRRRVRWFVAILGGSTRRLRRRPARYINSISIMGGDNVDLRDAVIDGNELVINVFALMGGPTIYLPDTIEVEISGPAILGGDDEHGSAREPRSGAPVIRIRSFSLMGGVDLWRLPPETHGLSLKQARRVAKGNSR